MEDCKQVVKDFLRNVIKLDLKYKEVEDDSKYQIICMLDSSETFDVVFSRLDKSDNLYELQNEKVATEEVISVLYKTEDEPQVIVNLKSKMGDAPEDDRFMLAITYYKEN